MSCVEFFDNEKVEIYKILWICIIQNTITKFHAPFSTWLTKFHLRMFVGLPSIQLWTCRGGPLGVIRPRSSRGAHGRLNHSTRPAERPLPVAVTPLHAATNEWSHIYAPGHKLIVIGKLTSRHRPFCHLLRHGEREVNRILSRLVPALSQSFAKNDRATCHAAKPMIPDFKMLGQTVTSEVRSRIMNTIKLRASR